MQEVGKEILVYDLDSHQAMHLNETSAAVWHLCDGKRTVPEISRELGRMSGTKASDEVVLLALDQLATRELLASTPDPFIPVHGSSRREALKRIAMSSAIALPLIAGIVAPTAAAAQSVLDCSACVKPNLTCGACGGETGTCYDNAGCGAGQVLGAYTCDACKALTCAGGPGTCSWKG